MVEEVAVTKNKKGVIDSVIDFSFSNDERKWLLFITFFGFLFRLINVNTRILTGDPAHFITNAINFIKSGIFVTWDQSAFLWYALTDIFYHIFGITQFASRFSSLLFGTLTIIAIYLFAKEFSGSKRIGFISAIIYAFAPAFIFNAADEHDISVLFFVIMAFYFLIRGLKSNSNKYILISAGVLGIACMWKIYVPILGIAYFGMIAYYHLVGKWNIQKNLKVIGLIFLILTLVCSPLLVYNYLNYQENGVTTFFFVKFFPSLHNEKIDQLYGWVSSGELYTNKTNLYELFVDGSTNAATGFKKSPMIINGLVNSVYPNGPILWFIIILGIILALANFKQTFPREYLIFFSLYFFVPFTFLITANNMTKHYVQFLAFAIPFAAYLINYLIVYFESKNIVKINILKDKMLYILLAIVFIQFFLVSSLSFNNSLLYQGNPEKGLIDYKLANIPQNSLIIYDDRIYNSLTAWLFNGRNAIPVSSLEQFMSYNEKSPNKKLVPLYLVECGIDQCAWATNPAMNSSIEMFFASARNQSIPKVASFKEQVVGDYYNPLFSKKVDSSDYYIVYKTDLMVDLDLAKQVSIQQSAFLYPVGYENKADPIFKNFVYTPLGGFDILLNSGARLMFYIDILASFLIILLLFYELINNRINNRTEGSD